jgi:hypothetical protein
MWLQSISGVLCLAILVVTSPHALAKGDDFNEVVKAIEQFYRVKHKGLPFLAKAGLKTASTAARLTGGTRKRLAEAGSVKVAYFEDQDFDSRGQINTFRKSITNLLTPDWSAFLETLTVKDEEQTYIFLREAKDKFKVLVVTIDKRSATVVQVDVSPRTLAQLMQDPDELGRSITVDATTVDDQE